MLQCLVQFEKIIKYLQMPILKLHPQYLHLLANEIWINFLPTGWIRCILAWFFAAYLIINLSLHCVYNYNIRAHLQKDKAIRLDAKVRQWIDLGIQDVCLAQLDCGSESGALSMWVKVGYSTFTGIITSMQNPFKKSEDLLFLIQETTSCKFNFKNCVKM